MAEPVGREPSYSATIVGFIDMDGKPPYHEVYLRDTSMTVAILALAAHFANDLRESRAWWFN